MGHQKRCFPVVNRHLLMGITASVNQPILYASPVDPLTL